MLVYEQDLGGEARPGARQWAPVMATRPASKARPARLQEETRINEGR